MSKSKADWVVAGGAPGELGYCTRCGDGLTINLPQRFEIVTACMNAFVEIHKTCKPGSYHPKPVTTPEAWAVGRDTGTSSLTIYHVMTGKPSHHSSYSIPWDPSDFGRCYRLLQLFPLWRGRLHEVAVKFPQWAPMVREWDRMEKLYERDLESGKSDELYKLMRDLAEEAKRQ